MKNSEIVGVIIGFIVAIGIYYLIISLVYWGICWAFNFDFSWKGAFGIVLIAALLNILFKKS